ncbi:hypothetical protein A6770_37310 [Nostoc minutum NIES-26]|uniref:Glycosyltransferase 2-like domain-containing protein n=1 Tax=Nostoc minutum NIES-26 TaxID=1844469 RepID=A0A367RWC4_9NOSO|nr:hypothetical protein A6770_37310 [Nostoc minutum NIES-26]
MLKLKMRNLINITQKIINKLYITLYRFINNKIESILYSKEFIQKFDRIKFFPQETRKISIAITHYERPELVVVTLKNIFRDERVSEIVILDDGSSLTSVFECIANLKDFKAKVKLFRRKENLGMLATKIQACSLCSNPWCILLDSDNTIFNSYLNAIFSLETWDKNIIYCPGYAFPNYDFRSYGNTEFDFEKICNFQNKNKILNNFIFSCFISGGNYFLNVKAFTNILNPYIKFKLYAADQIFANYIWLSNGNKLKLLPSASYYHRVHSNSTWILNSNRGHVEYNRVAKKFEEEQPATLENLLLEFENVAAIGQEIEHIPL